MAKAPDKSKAAKKPRKGATKKAAAEPSDRALDAMAAEATDDTIDLGTLATACALAYLDIRFPEHGWRDGRDGLAAWFTPLAERASMVATRPPTEG